MSSADPTKPKTTEKSKKKSKKSKSEVSTSTPTGQKQVKQVNVTVFSPASPQKLEDIKQEPLRKVVNQQVGKTTQVDYETLLKQNQYLQKQVSELNDKLNKTQTQLKQCQRNKEKYEKTCQKLNTQYCKEQSELQRYKSKEATVNLCELYQQLHKLNIQVEATGRKLVKDIKTEERAAYEKQLDKQLSEYNECKEALKQKKLFISDAQLNTEMAKFKDLCLKNGNKTKETMQKVYVIKMAAKLISEQVNTDMSNIINKVKALVEKHQKDLNDLKQISFSNDFKEEEVLFTNIAQLINDQKLQVENLSKLDIQKESNVLNTFNNTAPKSFNSQGETNQLPSSSKFGEFQVILYNFPENEEMDETLDLVNMKYFLGKFEIGVKDIAIKRLPSSSNEKIRPVVVTVPNHEVGTKLLNSSNKLSECGIPNVKLARYRGRVQVDDFDSWLKGLTSYSDKSEKNSNPNKNKSKNESKEDTSS